MICYMVLLVNHGDPYVIVDRIKNIQTAEVERSHYLEDNPSIDPLNVHCVQYRE